MGVLLVGGGAADGVGVVPAVGVGLDGLEGACVGVGEVGGEVIVGEGDAVAGAADTVDGIMAKESSPLELK